MEILASLIHVPDGIAVIFFCICWVGYARFTDNKCRAAKSLLATTNRYRTQWMVEMVKRDNRSTDAIMIGNLQRSITFFANTTIFIVAGLISMLSYQDRFSLIINTLPFATVPTPFMWEMKIMLLIIIFIYAFFKYTWSLRQYNYAGIFIASVPPHYEAIASTAAISAKGGYLVGNAANHFNKGLRAYYFGLATLPWFINPYLFIAATAWVVYVMYRREFHSATLANLLK